MKLKLLLLNEKNIWRGYKLCDFNQMILWERQNYRESKISEVKEREKRDEVAKHKDFQGSETTLCDTVMTDTCQHQK